MNSYLICPNIQIYSDLVNDFVNNRRQRGSGRQPCSQDSPCKIVNRQDFDNASFRGMFRNPTDTDTIFIVPELNWDDNYSVNTGYEIAVELMSGVGNKLSDDSFVNIIFVSLFTQKQLCAHVSPEYVEIVRSFPHISLGKLWSEESADSVPAVSIPAYSKLHYELLKRVVIDKSGRLDFIRHKLAHCTNFSSESKASLEAGITNAKNEIGKVLHLLELPFFGGDCAEQKEKIRNYFQQTDSLISKDGVIDLVSGIRQFIDEIKLRIRPRSENSLSGSHNEYKVLIVEDDAYYREQLTNFFKDYHVTAYSNAEIAGDGGEDALSRISKAAGQYHIVFLDMMYTFSGMEDDVSVRFNGFDLYTALRAEEAKTGKRKAAVRIVTALPRNDMSRLVKKYITYESPVIFTKGNGWEQFEGCLRDRMDEILKECDKNEKFFIAGAHAYPKAGVFCYPGMYDAIMSRKDNELKRALEFARKVVAGDPTAIQSFKNNCALTQTKNTSTMIGHLNAIMTHRALVIKYLKGKRRDSEEGGYIFKEEDYLEFIDEYVSSKSKFGKTYLVTELGFSVKKRRGEASYDWIIDIDDFTCFFNGEFDSCDDQDVLNTFIEYISNQLTVNVPDELCLYDEAGISYFLSLGKKTRDAFTDMLKNVTNYLTNTEIDKSRHHAIQSVFNDYCDMEDSPIKRARLEELGYNDIVGLVDRIVDFDANA